MGNVRFLGQVPLVLTAVMRNVRPHLKSRLSLKPPRRSAALTGLAPSGVIDTSRLPDQVAGSGAPEEKAEIAKIKTLWYPGQGQSPLSEMITFRSRR